MQRLAENLIVGLYHGQDAYYVVWLELVTVARMN